jgi:serine/threonine protein kinase
MAPEQARGESFDSRADLFSLGTVLYCLCAGESPFQAGSMPAVLRRISDEESWPLRQAAPDVPAWLEAMISYLHAKDPAQRPASAGEVVLLLEGYLEHWRRPEDLPPPDLPRLAKKGKGRRLAGFVAAALALAGVVSAGIFAWTNQRLHQTASAPRAPMMLIRPLTIDPVPNPPRTARSPGNLCGCPDLKRDLRNKSEQEIQQFIGQLMQVVEEVIKEARRRGMSSVRTPPQRVTHRYDGAGCT